MVTNLSTAIVTYLFNIMMLKYVGEAGVAAITIVLYGQFLFNAMYMGFSMGVAPVISYNHGSKNVVLLRRIFKICVWFISISSVVITAFALISSPIIVEIFTPKGTDTYTPVSYTHLDVYKRQRMIRSHIELKLIFFRF